jgi:protein-tyrosine phosphatase
VIDLHIHLLPGIDDGPADAEGTVALARACVADGVRAVAATPHVSESHPSTPQQIAQALARARAALEQAAVPLELHSGAEIAIDRLDGLSDDDLRALTIAGGGAYILIETPYAAWPMDLEQHAGRLATLGVRAILAHPERSAGVQAGGGIDRLEHAVGRGVYCQVTAGSLAGRFGRTAQAMARTLLERELVHVIASDAHDAERRPPRMTEAAAAVGSEPLANWLTEAAPLAILRGERLPPRPAPPARRGGGVLGRLRRRS